MAAPAGFVVQVGVADEDFVLEIHAHPDGEGFRGNSGLAAWQIGIA
jgi:hypothetical protein